MTTSSHTREGFALLAGPGLERGTQEERSMLEVPGMILGLLVRDVPAPAPAAGDARG